MKTMTQIKRLAAAVVVGVAMTTLVACGSSPMLSQNPDTTRARAALSALQNDATLANYAAAARSDAEKAVKAAEQPQYDRAVSDHLAYIATNKVKIARALASVQRAEDQLEAVNAERDQILLATRIQEANIATQQASAARERVLALEKELAELQAKKSDRGMVFTLSDVNFDTGKAELRPGTTAQFDRLADVLRKNPEQRIIVEGHTDNVGSDELNMSLSLRRAEAVKSYLINKGVNESMISATGKGKNFPVTSNSTPEGRQKNRRVEVIIENKE